MIDECEMMCECEACEQIIVCGDARIVYKCRHVCLLFSSNCFSSLFIQSLNGTIQIYIALYIFKKGSWQTALITVVLFLHEWEVGRTEIGQYIL